MIVLLLTFAAQSLVVAATAGKSALGTAVSAATSVARTALSLGGASAVPKTAAYKIPASKTATRRKACILKV